MPVTRCPHSTARKSGARKRPPRQSRGRNPTVPEPERVSQAAVLRWKNHSGACLLIQHGMQGGVFLFQRVKRFLHAGLGQQCIAESRIVRHGLVASFSHVCVSGHLRGVCQLMQPGGRQLQPIGPAQGTGIHKAAAEVSGLAQCFQQGASSGGEVGRTIEHALRVVAET